MFSNFRRGRTDKCANTRRRLIHKTNSVSVIILHMMLFMYRTSTSTLVSAVPNVNVNAYSKRSMINIFTGDKPMAMAMHASRMAFQQHPFQSTNLLRARSRSNSIHTTHTRTNTNTISSFLMPPSVFMPPISMTQKFSSTRIRSAPEDEMEMHSDLRYDVILNPLNDAQREAVTQPLESITRVVAGPGAGKTRVLICRIAYLLKKDNDNYNENEGGNNFNSRILAVTFTKKAASEMQHRLDSILREDEEYLNNLSATEISNQNEIDDDDDEIREEVVQSDNSVVTNKYGDSSSMITRVSLGTFHSICSKILRWNGAELARLPSIQHYSTKGQGGDMLDSSFAIIDQSEQLRIVKQCLTDAGIDLKGSGRGQADIRPITILNAVGQLKSDDAMGVDSRGGSDGEPADGIKMTSKVRNIAENVYPLYRTALLSQNSLDFDDLILYTRELLKTNDEVRERMSKRWDHILVDEFQDTSEVQLDLVKLLSRESLLIVGDGDQSIYSWRGAHAGSMQDFVGKFEKAKNKKVDTVFLMENYRSTTNIVKAAQKVISDKSTSDMNALERQDMKPMRGKGPSPRVLACADAKAEASFVVKEILKMEREGLMTSTSTLALIYRTNAQSRALEEACVEHNLKYLIRGSAGTFYSRAEIKDCLCFLKWLYNGRDLTAMARSMKTPSRGLGDVSLNEFATYCEEVGKHVAANDPDGPQPTALDILLSLSKTGQGDDRSYLPVDGVITKRTLNKLLPFAMQMNKLSRKAQSQTVTELLGSVIEIMGLKNHFDAISKTSDEFADRWANVMELLNASERYAQDGACLEKKKVEMDGVIQVEDLSPLGNFLDDVSLLTETEAADEGDNGERRLMANLMTIHASKGMEFDGVFLVGNEESTFPTQRAIMEGEGSVELDEERRLCYVAMTRAKTHLIMTWRKEVTSFFGQGFKINKTERSRFLDALMSKKKSEETTNANTRSNARAPRRTSTPVRDNFDSSQISGGRKFKKKKSRPQARASLRDLDPLTVPRPMKKKVKRKVSSARPSDTEYSRRLAMQALNKKADDREESEKWANYHANKNRSQAQPSRNIPAQTMRSAPKSDGGVSERGKRALSTKSRITPRGGTRSSTAAKRSTPTPTRSKRTNRLQENIRPESDMSSIPDMDSTMFFPLGSNVNHVIHGEGKVVKASSGQDAQNIHVQFDNGMQMDFPVSGGGLNMKY